MTDISHSHTVSNSSSLDWANESKRHPHGLCLFKYEKRSTMLQKKKSNIFMLKTKNILYFQNYKHKIECN